MAHMMSRWRKSPRAALAAPPAKAGLPRSPAATDWRMTVALAPLNRRQKTIALTMSSSPAARPPPRITWAARGPPLMPPRGECESAAARGRRRSSGSGRRADPARMRRRTCTRTSRSRHPASPPPALVGTSRSLRASRASGLPAAGDEQDHAERDRADRQPLRHGNRLLVLHRQLDAGDLGLVRLLGVAELASGEPEGAERDQDDGDDGQCLVVHGLLSPWGSCSAGVSASTSATIIVPVPSFVNTSASTLSRAM